jgi:N-glycosylase/DNA lyase
MKITKEDRKQLKKVLSGFQKRKTKRAIFYDLCFTLCAPQTTFVNNTKVIKELKKRKFYDHSVISLPQLCKPVRFYNNKAKYLREAKEKFDMIYKVTQSVTMDGYRKRDFLVTNVKGMGMKAASHFLRNLGYEDLAIIDTHILKFLAHDEHELKEVRKMATSKKGYESLEFDFKVEASDYRMTVAELDALVWKNYSNTDWKEFKY